MALGVGADLAPALGAASGLPEGLSKGVASGLSLGAASGLALAAVVLALAAAGVAALAWWRVGRLRTQVAALRADPAVVAGVDPQAVRHVAVVRYDAFADLGGQMSFSVALLDTAGDGVVLSAIHGRSDCRTYAKGVLAGAGAHPLSPEEEQAVAAALGRPPARSAGRPPGHPPGRAPSRSRR